MLLTDDARVDLAILLREVNASKEGCRSCVECAQVAVAVGYAALPCWARSVLAGMSDAEFLRVSRAAFPLGKQAG